MFGIDMEDTTLLRARSWRWLRTRIIGVLSSTESRTNKALQPPATP